MTALLYNQPVTGGASGYTSASSLTMAWQNGQCAKVWRLGTRIMSAALGKEMGAGLWKVTDRLNTDEPDALLDALEAVGVKHPSSFADCYHQMAPEVPRVRTTFNGMFEWWPGGPWSEARLTGDHKGTWRRYDLVSAYRWAATLGLPDPTTYHAVTSWSSDVSGLYVCELLDARPDLPPIFRGHGPVVMSSEEIEGYGVRVNILRGVQWSSDYPRTYVEHTLRKLPCAKESGRAYWGRWIARDPLVCWERSGKEWEMRNVAANFVWGWLIVGRVRLKLWEASQGAAHVYVDEVVTPAELPTGDRLGDWHLKETYPNGVRVVRTGAYGPLGGSFTMQTGVSRNGTDQIS